MNAHGRLMDKANINAAFIFDLNKSTKGNFVVDASLGPLDGKELNIAAMPLGMFEINDLKIKRLKAHIIGNNYSAHSSVLLIYDNLKITALKSDDSGKLKGRGILSFLANTFIVHKSNPRKNETAKPKAASSERDPQRSFFFLVWKSMLKGIIAVVT